MALPTDHSEAESLVDFAESLDEKLRDHPISDPEDGSTNLLPDQARIARVLQLLHGAFDEQTGRVKLTQTTDLENSADRFDEVPKRIGRFVLCEEVGQGGYGKVYRAVDQVLQRDVAIKVLPRHAVIGSGSTAPFREGRAAAKLSHPYLVPLYEVLADDNYTYLVSEYCDGPTLSAWLRSGQTAIPIAEAIEMAIKICQAVAYAHHRGLAHRDIKTGNILLIEEQVVAESDEPVCLTPRLTDFGLALDLAEAGEIGRADWVGTPPFMAPEQFDASPNANPKKADQYALGVVFFQLITGSLPFDQPDLEKLVDAIRHESPRPLSSLRSDVDVDLQAIIHRCLSKDPGDRYEDVQSLTDDLIRRRDHLPIHARPQGRTEQFMGFVQRHPIESILMSAVIFLSVAAAGVLLWSNQRLRISGNSLQSALELASDNAASANSFARQSEAALAEAKEQKVIAEANGRRAVQTAYRADMRQAFAACASGDPSMALLIASQVREYSESSIVDRADWRLLHTVARGGWRRLQPALPKSTEDANEDTAVEKVLIVPNRNWIVVAHRHGVVKVFDQLSGQLVHEISLQTKGPQGFVGRVRCYAAAVSDDEQWLAVGEAEDANLLSWYGQARVALISLDELEKSTQTFHEIKSLAKRRLSDFPATVESLCFSPSGRKLAVGIRYEPIQVVDLAESSKREFVHSERRNHAVTFINENELLLTPNKRESILFDLSSGDSQSIAQIMSRSSVEATVRSSSGRWILSSRANSQVFELQDTQVKSSQPFYCVSPFGEITCIAISPDESYIVVGSTNGGIATWQTIDFEKYQGVPMLVDGPNNVDGGRFVNPSAHHVLHDAAVRHIAVSKQNVLISGGADGSVASWSVNHHDSIDQTTPDLADRTQGQIARVVLSHDSETVYMGDDAGSLLSMDVRTGQKSTLLQAAAAQQPADTTGWEMETCVVALSPNGRWVAIGRRDCDVYIVEVEHPENFARFPVTGENANRSPSHLVFNESSDRVAICRESYFIDTYTIEATASTGHDLKQPDSMSWSLRSLASIRTEKSVEALCFRDDNSLLLIGDRIRNYEIGGAAEQEWGDGVQGVTASCLSHNQVVVASADARLRAFDFNGKLIATSRRWSPFESPLAGDQRISTMSFCEKDDLIVTGSANGDIGLWDAKGLLYLGSLRFSDDNLHQIKDIQLSADLSHLIFLQRRGYWQGLSAQSRLFQIELDQPSE